MVVHLPPNEMLADYASGAASPGVALLVSAHLTHSPESRRKVEEFEALGGALLADETPVAVAPNALDAALARLDQAEEASGPRTRHEAGPLPRPVIEAVGRDFDDIAWSFRLPGVAEHEFARYGDEKVSLLRAKPGSRIPQHTHEGVEMTLVLAGALKDGEAVYQAGDLAINTPEDDHKPTIIGDGTCYCLVVMDGRMRFTGRFSRALNLLGE